ncbi:Lipase, secreted [Cordyceps fumosorosea ARSEF 2679]|uniref:Lipase, secreted n=1 Tax=Cordyceps fumosorosea (strain ARSEF 2679) TaxID=1081104 RepID=A0A167R6H1_CORFA|nr:Lipase, secreted [Cordyceps fumosorosea ARSEF 2679]OAA58315.1 Lipase, secreted [Cordyceps fumosorosea ARSEF 2679]
MQVTLWSVARATLLLSTFLHSAHGRAIETAQGRAVETARDLIPVPAQDPFYVPPAGFESASPGAVLRSRKVVSSFFGLIPNPVATYQILYRTTAIDGSAIASVTTVFKPALAKKDRFVVWNTAYDSSATQCDPSYTYRLGSNVLPSIFTTNGIEQLIIQLYVLKGYIVSSPDYEGPDAAFTAGRLSGMGVLDSMRAVSNFGATLGLSTKTPAIVGAGYSGGGLATAWAAALHPVYAPELPVKGWSAGGIPANLTYIFEYIDGNLLSGFEAISLAGLQKPSAYGATLKPLLDSIATPALQKVFDFANTQCMVPNLLNFPFQSLYDTKYQSLGKSVLTNPTLLSVLQDNTLGVDKAQKPAAPFLMFHAKPDELVPYVPAAKTRDTWCADGATIKFVEYGNGGHITTAVLGLPDALQFADDVFANKIASGCTSKTVLDDTLNPLAFGISLEPLAINLINYLAALGKQDANWLAGIKKGAATR